MNVWRLIDTDVFEFSHDGEQPGALVHRRQIIEALTGETFPLGGVCPVVSKGHGGDIEWLWLGEIEPTWEKHPLDGVKALDAHWQAWFDNWLLEHRYVTSSEKLSRHIKKGY